MVLEVKQLKTINMHACFTSKPDPSACIQFEQILNLVMLASSAEGGNTRELKCEKYVTCPDDS
jgi:hypothetical protein